AGDLALRGGDTAAAQRHRSVAIGVFERVARVRPDVAIYHARTLVKLGDLAAATDPQAVESSYLRAHAVFEAAAAQPDATLTERDELGWSLERLGGAAWARGEFARTFALAQRRLDLAEDLFAADPDGLRAYHLGSALAHLVVYGRQQPAARPFDAATLRRHAERGAAMAAEAVRQQPSRRPFLVLAIRTHDYLASLASEANDLALAGSSVAAWVGFADALWESDRASDEALAHMLLARQAKARLLRRQGDLDGARNALVHHAHLVDRLEPERLPPAINRAQFDSLWADIDLVRRPR
ncbi:MAG: hypothetical protein JNK15_01680, partial [Planctomycetes bacterium]|nr:hypothetical protein [Planctomycetota bacterium]